MSLSPSIRVLFAYNERMTRASVVALALALLALAPSVACAADLSASPMIIDGKGKPRDILSYTIVLRNESKRLLTIYPWVTNFTASSGTEPMPDSTSADLSTSLANWIEVTRGVISLEPGESKEVPVLIQINLAAIPGERHALIKFAHGTNRIEAESNADGTLTIPVNIEVVDDARESLQLGRFAPTKRWFTGEEATFNVALDNTGNRGIVPRGKIRIYDRRGAEVASLDANQDGERLEPSTHALLSAVWNADGEFGRYKAFLDLSYGENGLATLQDTVFFWIIPWPKVVGLFLSIMVVSVIITLLLQTRGRARPRYALESASSADEQTPDASSPPGALGRLHSVLSQRVRRANAVKDTASSESSIRPRAYDSVDLSGGIRPVETLESSSNTIRLEAPRRAMPDPAHIIDLRK